MSAHDHWNAHAIEATGYFPSDDPKKKRAARYQRWREAAAVTPLKFTLMVRGEATQVEELSVWPPERWSGVRDSFYALQAAHAAILFLALGLRVSELAELRRDCLVDAGQGPVLSGATFKLSQQRSGRAREWPLPEIAVQAIRQQRVVSEFLRPGSDYLFVAGWGEEDGVFVADFRHLARAERDGRPVISLCDGNPNPHRFRKSVARLAALTLMGAGQILYEVFGHKDPEMTLSYMLSDPDLQAEIRVVAQEVSIALASEAVVGAEDNGGPAAPAFKAMVDRLVPRLAGAEMGSEDIRRAARVLSRDGAQVLLVRANVLCTKTTNQAGPCTRMAGAPDVGRCDAGCDHRLELAAAKQDHLAAIEQILVAFDEREELQRAWWAAQLRTHLVAFEEVRATYERDPRVRAILKYGEPPAQ